MGHIFTNTHPNAHAELILQTMAPQTNCIPESSVWTSTTRENIRYGTHIHIYTSKWEIYSHIYVQMGRIFKCIHPWCAYSHIIHPHAHAELILEINIYRKGVSTLAPPARVFVMGRAGGELRTGSMLGSFVCGGIVSGISSGCAFVA